ncbi:MAG: DEAD/DEAH box helicase [Opitutales bacterium]|nr:DEAD/DEAH box helicase [Opitutales bacterium]
MISNNKAEKMQTHSTQFGERLSLPDGWQRKALNCLRDGDDVVLHAPTGAGKTYVFEQLIESGWKGRAVYTVPTRALANDKFREWQQRGWEVGLVTGDLRYKPNARIIVATLETQRARISKGQGPDLFVVDEYQMLGDLRRGPGYEVTLAIASNQVRLLLMSGSVVNPLEVADWLRGHGRKVSLVTEGKRPVPLEEVFAEALLRRPFQGRKIRGHLPKLVHAALSSNLGPLLVFAPRRKAAEELAKQLAEELPIVDTLELTAEQKKVAGKELIPLLKRRVAYHHSGLDYKKRSGLVEPLAKAGQLQVVVATTGLAAGINFSMRSVLVTDREYRMDDGIYMLRPDELLQMFGRAGRRGLDDRGFIIVVPKQARMADARPLKLKRSTTLDWPALIRVMSDAVDQKKNHIEAARWLVNRFFSEQDLRLGFRDSLSAFITSREAHSIPEERTKEEDDQRDHVIEMRNSVGLWERQGGKLQARLGDALVLHKGEWVKALSLPNTLNKVNAGNPCRFGKRSDPAYGRELPIAVYEDNSNRTQVTLIKSFRHKLNQAVQTRPPKERKVLNRKKWKRQDLENVVKEFLPLVSCGGVFEQFVDRGKVLGARLRYEEATVLAWRDARGKMLLNPTLRKTTRIYDSPFKENIGSMTRGNLSNLSAAEAWFELGLIDANAKPTQRGKVFSCFSRGEGLAIAVALEDHNYPIEELVLDLANLRAGHRFRALSQIESRLSLVCREAFDFKDCPGYLKAGLPMEYGEGAAEMIRDESMIKSIELKSSDLSMGDWERVKVEWKSLLSLITHSPSFNYPRWESLQKEALQILGEKETTEDLPPLPEIPSRQKQRFQASG